MIKIISDALSGKRPLSAEPGVAAAAIDSTPVPSSLPDNKPPGGIEQGSREKPPGGIEQGSREKPPGWIEQGSREKPPGWIEQGSREKPDGSLQQALAAAENVWSQPTHEAGTSMSEAGTSMSNEQPLNDKVADAPQETPKDTGEMGTPLPRSVEKIAGAASGEKTQLVRGLQAMTRSEFKDDPVVGWFVVIGGPGLGAFRPIFEGNNTIGRSNTQRVPIDFGDDAISAEEQCYIRYDSSERRFLFVPNLAKTNVVSVNDEKPTGAVQLQAMDVITVGRTQLVFVPFCGDEFDWSELSDLKSD